MEIEHLYSVVLLQLNILMSGLLGCSHSTHLDSPQLEDMDNTQNNILTFENLSRSVSVHN